MQKAINDRKAAFLVKEIAAFFIICHNINHALISSQLPFQHQIDKISIKLPIKL